MRLSIFFLLASLAGCSWSDLPTDASYALRNATTMELLSLDPAPRDKDSDAEVFHGWTVLGTTQLSDDTTRNSLLDAFFAGVAENNTTSAACFEPRHGIKVTYDGKQYDFVICFRCYQCRWYVDGKDKGVFLLSRSPQATFNRILRDASVELADPASN